MDAYPSALQTDEGYSEHPLNSNGIPPALAKAGDVPAASSLAIRSPQAVPSWILRHLSSLSPSDRKQIARYLLDEMPTSDVAKIVDELKPRLYIDFISYLPTEVCLKILGYLDPLSLITLARCCRLWYDLALDRKLWQNLFILEGWKTVPSQISRWERKVNQTVQFPELQRLTSSEDGHAHKKRAISVPGADEDVDRVMVDAGRALNEEPEPIPNGGSIFGALSRTSMTPGLGKLSMGSSASSYPARSEYHASASAKGKGKEVDRSSSPDLDIVKASSLPEIYSTSPGSLVKSTLYMWDASSAKYRLNWKYLYSMRRRLEANWDAGRYVNFQFPHPDHLEERHAECIYSVQFDTRYLVSGSRDRTLRIWDMRTRRLLRQPLTGHRGSVLCLQFDSDPDEDIIVSGSSDSDVIVWRFSTGEIVQKLSNAHRESVLNLKFDRRVLVTCSKDKTIKVFNRRPLKPGDLGYGEPPMSSVPIHLKNYDNIGLDQMEIKPAFTMIGVLEGHGAAVNAVQIYGGEVVSASGDRNLKIWDWASGICLRTFVGHNKGIACVHYDGRRIVSGSSDNEVKVFDRHTSVEVASLRAHSMLVRTVQAGFGDLPYSTIEDEAEAAKIDQEYLRARETGLLPTISGRRNMPGNAGSKRPEDLTAYGAKLPPGGGGGKYGRIVSGSYDTTIIIWRRDKQGIWKAQHHLKQEDAEIYGLPGRPAPAGDAITRQPTAQPVAPTNQVAPAASIVTEPAAPTASTSAPPVLDAIHPPPGAQQQTVSMDSSVPHLVPTSLSQGSYAQIIDMYVAQEVNMLQQALANYPILLTRQGELQAAIDRQTSPFVRSQLRQAVNTAIVRTQIQQARQQRAGLATQLYTTQTGQSESSGVWPAENAAGPSSSAAAPVPQQGSTVPAPRVNGESSSSRPLPNGTGGSHDSQAIAEQTSGGVAAAAAAAAAAATATATATTTASQAGAPVAETTSTSLVAQVTGPPPAVTAVQQHPHIDADAANPPRVFKLQFDARQIVCCSQTRIIVGWDFCNGDPELEEVAQFFAAVE